MCSCLSTFVLIVYHIISVKYFTFFQLTIFQFGFRRQTHEVLSPVVFFWSCLWSL